MGWFKRKQQKPEFNFIDKYASKDMYFYKIKPWGMLDQETIFIGDKDDSGKIKMITLDYWPQEMFLDATREIEICDYLNVLVKQFQDSKMAVYLSQDGKRAVLKQSKFLIIRRICY
jgi:hypothetical protein